MSDDLRKLIEAVEAGDLSAINSSLGVMYSGLGNHWPWDWISKVNSAFRGSVDAAIALCEALLPGWHWNVSADGVARVVIPSVLRPPLIVGRSKHPARALLLAVLRAKLMETEDE